jgi:hypothetical protein
MFEFSVRNKIIYGYALAIGIAVAGTGAGLCVGQYHQQQAAQTLYIYDEEEYLLSQLQIHLLDVRTHQQQLIPWTSNSKAFEKELSHLVEDIDNSKKLLAKIKVFRSDRTLFDAAEQ